MDIYSCPKCSDYRFLMVYELHTDSETGKLIESAEGGFRQCVRCRTIIEVREDGTLIPDD